MTDFRLQALNSVTYLFTQKPATFSPLNVAHLEHVDKSEVVVGQSHIFIKLQHRFKVWDCILMSADSKPVV